jgi:hypothetical protein
VFYEYSEVPASKQLLGQPAVLQALQQRLAACVSSLQDEEVPSVQQLLQGSSSSAMQGNCCLTQQQHQRDETADGSAVWRNQVELRSLPAGHRAYNAAAAAAGNPQPLAVYACSGFEPGQLIGMYLAYVFDSKQAQQQGMFQSAADRAYFRYQFDFAVKAPAGAERQPLQGSGRSRGSSSGSGRGRDSGQQQTSHFLIDATCCLEGNPLAHMLDYRAFARDPSGQLAQQFAEDAGRSVAGSGNAMLLPFSDNSSGKVYCAVIALRCIAAGEQVCIDYGAAYWEVS